MKQCSLCKTKKPLDNFYKQGQGYLTSECKKCKVKRNTKYDKAHIEQKRKRAREYERRKRLKKQSVTTNEK